MYGLAPGTYKRYPVLRSLCSNPNGLFWAGDTAQTISVGSSFRFNDLKAFLFHVVGLYLSVHWYIQLSSDINTGAASC